MNRKTHPSSSETQGSRWQSLRAVRSEERYRFEDWLVMETGKFDGRRIYSEAEIKDLIENNQIVPLYMNASRPSSSRLELIENKYHNYELYYQKTDI